jgi:thymidylate synthase ThyX
MITAKILLDSVNPMGNRITTWILTYPRFIHAEFMTHRVFSRNASSSRAIPVKKMLEDVKNNPAMPVFWGKNQSGMQAKEELDNTEKYAEVRKDLKYGEGLLITTKKQEAKREWLLARDEMVARVEKLNEIGLHKQIANRLLEPWMNITVIATATDHENFLSLRAHEDTQPEFQDLAYKMLDLYQSKEPNKLKEGEWHIPFGDKLDEDRLLVLADKARDLRAFVQADDDKIVQMHADELRKKISTARCARVSYLNFEGKDDYTKDIELHDILKNSGHWSPFEHCAMALNKPEQSGNFVGWKQYRKMFNGENRSDGRVQRYNE